MFKILSFLVSKFRSTIYYALGYWYYKAIFGKLGSRSMIKTRGLRLEFPGNIFIGNRVFISTNAWLAASPHVNTHPKLVIKDGVNIGRYNQIYSTSSIIIEENVLIADRVFISDSAHGSQDISLPIMYQKITTKGAMVIGKGTWIGINVAIIGASVGKNCVIGANSVVTKNIPDYCIVSGSPAVIIKRFNTDTKHWERTTKDGEFLS